MENKIIRSKQYNKTLKLFIDMNKDISLLEDFLHFVTNEDKGIRGKGYNYMNAIRVFEDIVMNNKDNFMQLFENYSLSKSQKEKTLIRRGEKEVKLYTERLKGRPRPEIFSIYTSTYWKDTGRILVYQRKKQEKRFHRYREKIQIKDMLKAHQKITSG